MVLAPLGHGADRVLVVLTLVSFLVLVWALYRLGAASFTMLVGVARRRSSARASTSRSSRRAATSTSRSWRSSSGPACSRPSARAAARPVLVLLLLAGLLRPEAWLLSGLYWL